MLDERDEIVTSACAIRVEMQSVVRTAAEPWVPGDSVKAALTRASRNLELPYRRVRSFWYAQADAWAHEADVLRAWHRCWKRDRAKRLANELAVLQLQLGALDE